MEKIRIKGLLFEEIDQLFTSSISSLLQESDIPLEELIVKIQNNYEKIANALDDSISSSYLQFNKFNLNEFVKGHTNNQKKIVLANEQSFKYFLIYINTCYIIYQKGIDVMQRKRLPSVLKICMSLYGLILRRADQIVTMLFDGYIDGAMIVWRSLYEYVVTMMAIALENDNDLADRYYTHSIKNAKKKVESYSKHYKELKFKALSKRTHHNLRKWEDNVTSKYGKEFINNEYGWADNLFPGNQKASLRLLEERVGMQRFRPYYLICTEQAHSNFNGFKHFMVGNKVILNGLHRREIETEAFVDPMQFTISILDEVTDYILFTFSAVEEYNINSIFLDKVFRAMQGTFNSEGNK